MSELKGTEGPVYTPESVEYDEQRGGYQRVTAHRPALVVAATGAEDVRAAVEHAAREGLRVAVQAGGHGLGEPLEGGVLISTRRMSGVRVDPVAGTAWVEAGASWGRVIEAAAPHGLAPLSGSSPGVGAVPYTLGGGVGLMARRYGFAADHVRRLTVVTADGRIRDVTPDTEPGLFWALRGGGGAFGVVTGMEIGLVPVERLYGGGLYFDVERVPGVLTAWHRWTATVPEETTSAVALLPMPDLPMIPEPLRGRYVAQIQIAHLGAEEEGRRLTEPLRALGPALRDTLRELPYTESATIFDEPDHPHAYLSRNRLLRDLDPDTLATLLATTGPSAPVMTVVQFRHLGGALARPPRVPNAIGHRGAARYSLNVLSPVEPGGEESARAAHRAAVAPFEREAVGTLLNFSYGPLDKDTVRSAFEPGDHERLARLKARLDPRDLLHGAWPIGSVQESRG
ncbi:FAD-binding oxidoreductase [Spongiactinospora sp. TRM90649]|uniref:FAD-binding oxidoreductase n=1 Tax=Spongiactinospora sp. TRM90649 TaxID=3031114 RepID=UPI0023F8D072|nr:FAD-binding oxidoreductase [Spongiactinospora sp. TRM90649]MDF5758979.1 FAD-binding oxidoreductase [Spongiactinospora sp. TRM90649]